MTYRVVKIEPCENGPYICSTIVNREAAGQRADHYTCYGCRGDGTRMVDVCEAKPLTSYFGTVWVEVES